MYHGQHGGWDMDLKQCDVKDCDILMKPGEEHVVQFLGQEYDFCEQCYTAVKEWAEGILQGGREIQKEIRLVPTGSGVNIPATYPNITAEQWWEPQQPIWEYKYGSSTCGPHNPKRDPQYTANPTFYECWSSNVVNLEGLAASLTKGNTDEADKLP
jgi:hypothetical protein